jgi:biopolymer transport protein ExbB
MIEAGLAEIPRLERRMGVMAVVSRLAPMLGLLGTVLSLMDALLVMHQRAPLIHSGDLTASLWRALVCTAAGLAVAIPSFAAYNLLVGRVESILIDMERAVGEVLDQLAQERRRIAGRGE